LRWPLVSSCCVHFRYAQENIPYAVERYQKEPRRLLEVLDTRLADNEYLAGAYSVADIANFSWARTADWSGVESRDLEHLSRWIEAIQVRPGAASTCRRKTNLAKPMTSSSNRCKKW